MSRALTGLQPFVQNPLPPRPSIHTWACGLIGDHPSTYSRSPAIWNAAFAALELDAAYVPFDVEPSLLAGLLGAIRREPRFLGVNVTVPYKQAVVPLLDDLDERAERLGAVNTVVRTVEGRLLGTNTDGEGAISSLTQAWPGQPTPFLASLDRRSVLLVGAGGAGSAVAYALAQAIGPRGRLFIANRTPATALTLGLKVDELYGNAQGLDEADAELLAPGIDLVVNATTRGQAGAKVTGQGQVAYLEPYSALAPAAPPSVPEEPGEPETDRMQRWFAAAIPSIEENHALSMRFATRVARHTAFFDVIYAPSEPTTLRHARWAGRPTLNGRGMIVFQAVAAFYDYIARPLLDGRPAGRPAREAVVDAMAASWPA
ncbi:MAG: hypothetical protein IT305_13540 [Chloroflexi bacterium]|nr:hypothetical protein [Chloroflexota bacterium]